MSETVIGSVYVIFNFSGVVANLGLLWYFKYRVHPLNSHHIFLGNYALGCIILSITCGMQCLLGLTNGSEFYGGEIACGVEAYFHISSILVQFFSVTMMCVRNYLETIHGKHIRNYQAYIICVVIWGACIGVTLGLATISPVYLMSNGVYCFFDFSSPAIAYWLLPSLIISILVMTALYTRIFLVARKIFKSHAQSVASFDASAEYAARLARRSFSTVALVLICWSPAGITSVYELTVGRTPPSLVTLVGVMGTLHSLLVPIIYGLFIYQGSLVARQAPEPRTKLSLSSPRRLAYRTIKVHNPIK
jgi:hypothetical protein